MTKLEDIYRWFFWGLMLLVPIAWISLALFLFISVPKASGHTKNTLAGIVSYNTLEGKLYICGFPVTWEDWDEMTQKINGMREEI